MKVNRFIIGTFLAFLALEAPIAPPAMAQGAEAFVIVPDNPNPIPVNGCYLANRSLFGHTFSFCLHRPGTYQVRGGGVWCDGRMTWHTRGRDIIADIHRTSCGSGIAWERASMDCRPAGSFLGPVASLFIRSLRCTYFPTVRGQRQQTFIANRR
jgi:hypothetical protein